MAWHPSTFAAELIIVCLSYFANDFWFSISLLWSKIKPSFYSGFIRVLHPILRGTKMIMTWFIDLNSRLIAKYCSFLECRRLIRMKCFCETRLVWLVWRTWWQVYRLNWSQFYFVFSWTLTACLKHQILKQALD